LKFIIHRGTKQIGGNCVEVVAGRTRIILDVGLPLDFMDNTFIDRRTCRKPRSYFPSTDPHVPKVPGLFQEGPPVDAILLSHAHADHAGLLNYANPAIPVYCTKGTSKMLMAGSIFANQVKLEKSRERKIAELEPTRIGDFVVTAYPVDHSAFDSVAFLIEADGKRLLYSGDLRMHGRKPGMVRQLLAGVASKPIDVLMMEGTHFSGQRKPGCTEKELELKILEHIRPLSGLVLANFSPMHLDRLVTFYKAARKASRIFVVDPYAAFVLRLAAGQCRVPKPEAKNGIMVYYNQHFEQTWQKRNLAKIHAMFLQDRIEMDTILSKPREYVMVCRPSMLKCDFHGTFPSESTWIYSYWEGYMDRPTSEFPNLKAKLQETGGSFVIYHTSGHILAGDIEKFVEALNPEHIVPIHTTGRSEFQKRFKNVLLVQDGDIRELNNKSIYDNKSICDNK
jgi:ribonuclease J